MVDNEEKPALFDIYPEYFSDFNVGNCPSTSYGTPLPVDNSFGLDISAQYCNEDTNPYAGSGKTPPEQVFNSYTYYGKILDKVQPDDPHAAAWAVELMGNPGNQSPSSEWEQIPAQFLLYYWSEGGGTSFAQSSDTTDPLEFMKLQHQDVQLMDDDLDWIIPDRTGPMGNGNTNTLFHLKEGVEQFMITDINNPGASALAQSTLPMMWDVLGQGNAVVWFNHAPGGANVLYLDGHVQFHKYPSRFPATIGLARIYGQWATWV